MMIRFKKSERSKPKLGLNQRRYLKVRAENNAIAEKAKEGRWAYGWRLNSNSEYENGIVQED